MRKFIDLSVPMDEGAKEFSPPDIQYNKHLDTVERAANAFDIDPKCWPDGKAWATEQVSLSTHTGTHADAPFHYWDKTGNKPAKTIDEVPLDWFYGDGVKLDFTWKKPGTTISKNEIIQALKEINYTLKSRDIVLIHTGADKKLYDRDYINSHSGVSAEATKYLISYGIKVMGTDGYGWDVPFKVQGDKFKETGDPNVLWEAHYVGKELEYCQLEKLANLEKIPYSFGFTVIAFPIKISGASGGWVRAVAMY